MNTSFSKRLCAPLGTPESEFSNSNFECFQNYTAPEVFIQGLAGIVNQGDVELMIRAQKQMYVLLYKKYINQTYLYIFSNNSNRLQRFEKTNEMLLNCNALSVSRMKTAGEDFKKHTKLLNEMKKDLDYIFKKIRAIQAKVSTQYPDAFAEAQPQRGSFAEEAEDEYEKTNAQEHKPSANSPSTSKAASAAEPKHSKKVANARETSSVGYVKMKQSPDNGAQWSNGATANRKSIGSNNSLSTENSNDSSEGTSDTG